MRRSRGIIYFYNINEKIDEHRLNLVIEQIMTVIPILFVGYASNLPSNPEKNDQNIPLIQNYLGDFNPLYISVDNPDSMFQILDA